MIDVHVMSAVRTAIGGIALRHPVGASGAIKLVHEPAPTGGRYGLATTRIGGGPGSAAILERATWRLRARPRG